MESIYEMSRKVNTETESRSVVAYNQGVEAVTANRHKGTFGGNKNVLKWNCGDG